jgi:hypothetical protein
MWVFVQFKEKFSLSADKQEPASDGFAAAKKYF